MYLEYQEASVSEQEKVTKTERKRKLSQKDGEITIPISPATDIIRNTLCLLTDRHRARLDTVAASGKMLRANLWQSKCGYVLEASTFTSALLILFFQGLHFLYGNRAAVMNSCRVQTMSPL